MIAILLHNIAQNVSNGEYMSLKQNIFTKFEFHKNVTYSLSNLQRIFK